MAVAADVAPAGSTGPRHSLRRAWQAAAHATASTVRPLPGVASEACTAVWMSSACCCELPMAIMGGAVTPLLASRPREVCSGRTGGSHEFVAEGVAVAGNGVLAAIAAARHR